MSSLKTHEFMILDSSTLCPTQVLSTRIAKRPAGRVDRLGSMRLHEKNIWIKVDALTMANLQAALGQEGGAWKSVRNLPRNIMHGSIPHASSKAREASNF